ncbi:hypothetical protein PIB30_015227, partial [Stylosanthes scabra]|nr:hypothetical protein [Stylosanthes scabra]
MAAVFPWNRDKGAAGNGAADSAFAKGKVEDITDVGSRTDLSMMHHLERDDSKSSGGGGAWRGTEGKHGGGAWLMMEDDVWVFRVESSVSLSIELWMEREGRVAELRSWTNEVLRWKPCIFSWASGKPKCTRHA